MAVFGQCSDSSCNESAVRLFDCAHHCMKLVCLKHLIEHDQLIEHNEEYVDNFRTELKQLWLTYTSLFDETKLRSEYEDKLKKHQELIHDYTNLFENNSCNNIEQCRFMLEKFKQYIEREKQHSNELFPSIERIKIEPNNDNSDTNLLNINTVTHFGRDDENKQDILNSSIRKLSGRCPFWFDGAYGLTEEHHGMYLCSHVKSYQSLYRHLLKFHKLTLSSIKIICEGIQNKQDPLKEKLFELNSKVIDEINQIHCPFSVTNQSSLIKPNLSQRYCRRSKPQLGYSLREHLMTYHKMDVFNANKLISKIKIFQ